MESFIKQAFADTSYHPGMSNIQKREVKIAPDGNSAIVVDQYFAAFSPKIQVRSLTFLVKMDNKWKIHLINWSLVAKNEDLEKLNKAIE